jgi:hypothetical protein
MSCRANVPGRYSCLPRAAIRISPRIARFRRDKPVIRQLDAETG